MRGQPTPYPGGNLFSLASGGAIYVRDPHHLVAKDCLNGGEFAPLATVRPLGIAVLAKETLKEETPRRARSAPPAVA